MGVLFTCMCAVKRSQSQNTATEKTPTRLQYTSFHRMKPNQVVVARLFAMANHGYPILYFILYENYGVFLPHIIK